jgi:hypothetical protein
MLTSNSYSRENSLENKYLYNGKELQDELDFSEESFGPLKSPLDRLAQLAPKTFPIYMRPKCFFGS